MSEAEREQLAEQVDHQLDGRRRSVVLQNQRALFVLGKRRGPDRVFFRAMVPAPDLGQHALARPHSNESGPAGHVESEVLVNVERTRRHEIRHLNAVRDREAPPELLRLLGDDEHVLGHVNHAGPPNGVHRTRPPRGSERDRPGLRRER